MSTRILLATPTLMGQDGLSCLSRQLREALTLLDAGPVDVMSLGDMSADGMVGAGGDRMRFGWNLLQAAASQQPALAMVTHLHLLPAIWPLLLRGTPVVPVLVGVEAWCPLSRARALVLARVPRAVAISHHTEREFRRANPSFGSLSVDVCWPATPELPLASVNTPPAHPFALIVGRLAADERYKGHDLLLDIWPRVVSAVPDARLVVAGTGDDLGRLRQRATDLGLAAFVSFEGAVSSDRLSALYAQCAFLALPSRNEGFGYVFLEAMAAGRACLGSVGAAEEIIEADVTGLVVDPSQPGALTSAVTTLFRDVGRRDRMGGAGRLRAERIFSMERFSSDLGNALASWLPDRSLTARC